MEVLQIRMLGQFSLEAQGRRLDASEDRSCKPWLLLAYLLYHRSRVVTQEELLRLCWGSENTRGDLSNALRVVLHRTRIMLDRLELMPGKEMIVRSWDGFQWNDRLPVRIDVEVFQEMYRSGKAAAQPEEKLACFERAMDCYRGEFLGGNTGENWGACIENYHREIYMEMALEMLNLLADAGETQRMIEVCRQVLKVEPFNEEIYRRLMKTLMEQGKAREAARLYEQLREKLLTEFDRVPEERTGDTYFSVLRAMNPAVVPVALERLDVDCSGDDRGAKLCDFSFYRMFYSSAEWLIERCGLSVYNVLFTMEVKPGRSVSQRTQDRLMEGLAEQLRAGWSRGDALTRCAEDQILGMVQAGSYEAACMICEEQVERFYRGHSNVPVCLRYGVWRVGKENEA